MPRRLAQQRMTLSDRFTVPRTISVVAELFVNSTFPLYFICTLLSLILKPPLINHSNSSCKRCYTVM